MIIKKVVLLGTSLSLCLPFTSMGQNTLKFNDDAVKSTHIAVGADTLFLSYDAGITSLPVMSQQALTATALDADGQAASWFRVYKADGDRVIVAQDYHYGIDKKTGILRLATNDGATRDVAVVQNGNSSVTTLKGDTKLTVTATANQSQSGEGAANSCDGDYSTIYHSPWSGTTFPVVLTYTLSQAAHVDYLVYHPRQSGGSNGNFGKVVIEYVTNDAPNDWKQLADTDFGQSSSASRVDFGKDGVDAVKRVRFTVSSGYGGFASCSEMEFYQRNEENTAIMDALFTDHLCTALKPGVTAETINSCGNAYFRQLGLTLLNNGYTDWQKKFRIGTFSCYETISTLASRLKTNTYNAYENPTGIYFKKDQPVAVFVKGIGDKPVSLIVHDFGNFGSGNDSRYSLSNGINVITPTTSGNGYVSYYAAPGEFESAPDVEIHFALADVNGYFDLGRGDTNEDWKKLLSNACSNIIDVRTPRMQVAFPTDKFKQLCPNNGVELAQTYDDVIYREREILGLIRYGEEPKNRQFARVVSSGMFADGTGAAAADPSGWMKPSRADFDFWGFAHELGHVNQVRPSFKWTGLGECTNNIYSTWVQFSLSTASWLRLESENSPVYNSADELQLQATGGRFNCYLLQNVCEGVTWQFANGGDYHGQTATDYTVTDEDEDGNEISGATFTGPRRNYDHFVKVAPLWQLQLYSDPAGFSPDLYAKVMKGLRGASDKNSKGQSMTNGQQQIRFIRTVCDSTKLNFLPFFEKAGMFRAVKRIIEDYTPGLLCISQKMIDELTQHVAEAGYPEPEGEVNYISGLNWEMYKNKAALVTGEVNQGCTNNGTSVTVSNKVWQNAVAFETYDADGKMVAISMYGLGGGDNTSNITSTKVLFPSGATTIKAVSWNGERAVVYQKN